jgi:hypothetical protein
MSPRISAQVGPVTRTAAASAPAVVDSASGARVWIDAWEAKKGKDKVGVGACPRSAYIDD